MRLLRRVHPSKMNGSIPDSSLFKKQGSEVGVSTTLWQTREDEICILRDRETEGLISIRVGFLRSLGFGIVRTALVGNLNHCDVFGQFSSSNRKAIRDEAKWVKYPDSYAGVQVMLESR